MLNSGFEMKGISTTTPPEDNRTFPLADVKDDVRVVHIISLVVQGTNPLRGHAGQPPGAKAQCHGVLMKPPRRLRFS